jgi:phosphoheptose isomerase|tara:strand:- start:1519 stop:2142 length:624 start_codon:yes stop_codon:yes gene_type:complete
MKPNMNINRGNPMTDTIQDDIAKHLEISSQIKMLAAGQCAGPAAEAAAVIADSLKKGGKLMLCGNGGSAGDAQHIAAEFVATLDHRRPRKGLAALALTTDTSFITAYSNDFGYDGIFARQVETLGRDGDVLIGISTSGNSGNVVAALEIARDNGITTIALTGQGGGSMAGMADIAIMVPSDQTPLIQETHIALGHAITAGVEKLLGH